MVWGAYSRAYGTHTVVYITTYTVGECEQTVNKWAKCKQIVNGNGYKKKAQLDGMREGV